MGKNQNYYIIIPAFNEAKRLGGVIKKIKEKNRIIVVDDGSNDRTSKIANKYRVLVLKHRINLGKGAAMKTGIEAAIMLGAKKIIFMDADGQHDPKYIPEFLMKLEKSDIVFGKRKYSNKPWVRYLGHKLALSLIKFIFHIQNSDMLCGFIALKAKTYKEIVWNSARYGVETEIAVKVKKKKLKYKEIPIKSVYLDRYKGVTLLDAFDVLANIPRWIKT